MEAPLCLKSFSHRVCKNQFSLHLMTPQRSLQRAGRAAFISPWGPPRRHDKVFPPAWISKQCNPCGGRSQSRRLFLAAEQRSCNIRRRVRSFYITYKKNLLFASGAAFYFALPVYYRLKVLSLKRAASGTAAANLYLSATKFLVQKEELTVGHSLLSSHPVQISAGFLDADQHRHAYLYPENPRAWRV